MICKRKDTGTYHGTRENHQMSFLANGNGGGKGKIVPPANGGTPRSGIACYDCREKGHYTDQCLNKNEKKEDGGEDFTGLTVGAEDGDDDDSKF
eukprot:11560429-Ditylum_brightwellii.AAC.1